VIFQTGLQHFHCSCEVRVTRELDYYQYQPQNHQPLRRSGVDYSFTFATAKEVAEIALKDKNHRMICDQTGHVKLIVRDMQPQNQNRRHPTPGTSAPLRATCFNLTISQSHTPAIQSLAELRKQPRHTGLSPDRGPKHPPAARLTALEPWLQADSPGSLVRQMSVLLRAAGVPITPAHPPEITSCLDADVVGMPGWLGKVGRSC
jgi:hypothetical protein